MRRGLSEREREVLQALWDYDGNRKRVAAALFIEVTTVATHMDSIFRILGVHSTMAALKQGLIQGLIYEESLRRWDFIRSISTNTAPDWNHATKRHLTVKR